MHLFLSILLASFIALVSKRFNLLKVSGAFATFFLALIIFYFGNLKWTIPILTFFILSSTLSKLRKRNNPKVDLISEKTEERDHVQVLANGGVPGLLILINQVFTSELFYVAYVSAIAAVCSDTWATEIGTFFTSKTYNIMNFSLVEQGVSGGISLIGIMGATFGSITIAISALIWLIHFDVLMIIIICGLLASTLDSVLGATVQAKYNCSICNKIIERKTHCGVSTLHSKGLKWFNNDVVNLAASTFGAVSSILFSVLIL